MAIPYCRRNNITFRISYYATTHTERSTFIIGGNTGGSPVRTATIARFKDNIWKKVGSLKQARSSHGAITVRGKTIIVGGFTT